MITSAWYNLTSNKFLWKEVKLQLEEVEKGSNSKRMRIRKNDQIECEFVEISPPSLSRESSIKWNPTSSILSALLFFRHATLNPENNSEALAYRGGGSLCDGLPLRHKNEK